MKQVKQTTPSTNLKYTLYVDGASRTAQFEIKGTGKDIAVGQANYEQSGWVPSNYRPKNNLFTFISRNQHIYLYLWNNGTVGLTNWASSMQSNQEFQAVIQWEY